jgi:hypothetical protein
MRWAHDIAGQILDEEFSALPAAHAHTTNATELLSPLASRRASQLGISATLFRRESSAGLGGDSPSVSRASSALPGPRGAGFGFSNAADAAMAKLSPEFMQQFAPASTSTSASGQSQAHTPSISSTTSSPAKPSPAPGTPLRGPPSSTTSVSAAPGSPLYIASPSKPDARLRPPPAPLAGDLSSLLSRQRVAQHIDCGVHYFHPAPHIPRNRYGFTGALNSYVPLRRLVHTITQNITRYQGMYQLKIWRLGRILSSCRVRDSGRDREIAAILQEAEKAGQLHSFAIGAVASTMLGPLPKAGAMTALQLMQTASEGKADSEVARGRGPSPSKGKPSLREESDTEFAKAYEATMYEPEADAFVEHVVLKSDIVKAQQIDNTWSDGRVNNGFVQALVPQRPSELHAAVAMPIPEEDEDANSPLHASGKRPQHASALRGQQSSTSLLSTSLPPVALPDSASSPRGGPPHLQLVSYGPSIGASPRSNTASAIHRSHVSLPLPSVGGQVTRRHSAVVNAASPRAEDNTSASPRSAAGADTAGSGGGYSRSPGLRRGSLHGQSSPTLPSLRPGAAASSTHPRNASIDLDVPPSVASAPHGTPTPAPAASPSASAAAALPSISRRASTLSAGGWSTSASASGPLPRSLPGVHTATTGSKTRQAPRPRRPADPAQLVSRIGASGASSKAGRERMLARALDRIENTHIDQDPETYHRVVKGLKQQRPPGAAAEAKKQTPNSFKRLLAIQKQITNGGPNADANPDVFHKYGAGKSISNHISTSTDSWLQFRPDSNQVMTRPTVWNYPYWIASTKQE